ncbi:hypothetical protein AHAS_Ahas16G0098500 [Arachis hypogaea]
MQEKCYLWATHVKTYGDGGTNEYEPVCILNGQQPLQLSKINFASLKVSRYIKAENMAIGNHEGGDFLQPKTKKPFNIEYYKMFIPFLDLKKLASHPYGYVISRMRVYAGGHLSRKTIMKLNRHASTFYDCVIYVMKWLEIIKSQNIKKEKYKWENWTQAEVDHFRVEYASQILFHDMNRDRDTSIRECEAIRLSKPSTVLLSPYCQIDSDDIDSD